MVKKASGRDKYKHQLTSWKKRERREREQAAGTADGRKVMTGEREINFEVQQKE